MTGAGPGDEGAGEPAWTGPLPEPVRLRVVGFAATALGGLADDEVPAGLRPFRSAAASRRTRRAATPLALAVERDVLFRQRAYAAARAELPDLAEALDTGAVPAAADPVDVAAVAYLGRTSGWDARVAAADAELSRAGAAAVAGEAAREAQRLAADLAAARESAARDLALARERVEAATAELAAVRKELRAEKGARRRAEQAVGDAQEAVAAARAEAAGAVAAATAAAKAAQGRQAEAEAALAGTRRAAREGRSAQDARLQLLLDTLRDAAAGLRRELALPPAGERPADLVEALHPGDPVEGAAQRALLPDDPALLDQLLALPAVHLVVDGYNVTKTGFPDLPLEAQRSRLVTGLAALAAQSGAEVTCCFDGASLHGRVPSVGARGVRVRFSRPGETADDLIRALVRAEPPGRVVVVVSSDREVADGVRRAGARPVPAAALVRRLGRS